MGFEGFGGVSIGIKKKAIPFVKAVIVSPWFLFPPVNGRLQILRAFIWHVRAREFVDSSNGETRTLTKRSEVVYQPGGHKNIYKLFVWSS